MRTCVLSKYAYAIIFVMGLLACSVTNAWHGGGGGGGRGYHGGGDYHGGGGYYHGGDYHNGGYYHGGTYYGGTYYGSPGVVIGVPLGGAAAYPNSCVPTQQCDANGYCVQTQVCN
ncbi:MAG: hypothetical protein Q8R79_02940 [Legionellaceae bacterium]|nr:hypothetical protein [Legionellaceae bacterium]